MNARRGTSLFLFGLSLVAGFAQENRPAGQPRPPAAVPGCADRRITLDVAVTDKSGKPVTGLAASDFTLLDNKQPQKILSFRAIDGSQAAADMPVEAVLVIDEVNTPFTGVARIRDEIVKFLGQNGGKLALPSSVVLITDSGTTVRTEPSRDGNALIANLNKSEFGLRTIHNSSQYAAFDEQRLSIKALGQLASSETSRPGRKLVVWVSPGWPLFPGLDARLSSEEKQAVFRNIVAFSDNLRSVRVTLCNVDPLGPTEEELQKIAYRQFLKGAKNAQQAEFGSLGVQVLAVQSGGLVLNTSNDVAGEIAACV